MGRHHHGNRLAGGGVAQHSALPSANARIGERLWEWIEEDRRSAGGAATDWTATLGENGLHFEGRPYPVSLRPILIEPEEARALERKYALLFGILEKTLELYKRDPSVRHFFRAYRDHERLILGYPSYRPLIRACRFDCAWFGGDDFKIYETNTACPGGVIQNGLAARLWRSTQAAQILTKELDIREQPFVGDPHLFAKELVSVAWAAGVNEPSATVVNLKGCYTNEVDWIISDLNELGVAASLCDVRELKLRDGIVYAADRPVSLVYNKLDPLMLVAEPDATDYLEAVRGEDVCSVNPLVAQLIAEDKSVLAFVGDPDHADHFTLEERAVIEDHVPWTRVLDNRRTTDPGGTSVDLVGYVSQHRESLVLKPCNLSRGEGVVIGANVTDAEWRKALKFALTENYVVQEYVPLPTMDVPLPDLSGMRRMQYGLDCYLFGGRLVGFQSRTSLKDVINVGRGGSLLPVIEAGRA